MQLTEESRFQEYHLANRLLIFASNGQVYFSYKETVYSEEVTPGKHFEPDAAMLNGAQPMSLHLDQDRQWSTYRRVVQEYTKRKLTQPGDVLNAFSGVSKNICRERFIDGLPVYMFDLALLWQPREYLQRREGFSNWSWAGWIGQVHFSDDRCLDDYREQHDIKREQIQRQFETQTCLSPWRTTTTARFCFECGRSGEVFPGTTAKCLTNALVTFGCLEKRRQQAAADSLSSILDNVSLLWH